MKVKLNPKNIIFISFLVIGIFISILTNHLLFGLIFISTLIYYTSYVLTKHRNSSVLIKKVNQTIPFLIISITTISILTLFIKLILSMFLGNLWSMIILDYGNSLFKYVAIFLTLIELTTIILNLNLLRQKKD